MLTIDGIICNWLRQGVRVVLEPVVKPIPNPTGPPDTTYCEVEWKVGAVRNRYYKYGSSLIHALEQVDQGLREKGVIK